METKVKKLRIRLFVVALLLCVPWWISERGYEPVVVFFTLLAGLLGMLTHEKVRTWTGRENKDLSTDDWPVLRLKGKSVVQTFGAPAINELKMLLLDRYPKWTTDKYLERSLECLSQPLPKAIEEMIFVRQLVEKNRLGKGKKYRLTPVGKEDAVEVEARYRADKSS